MRYEIYYRDPFGVYISVYMYRGSVIGYFSPIRMKALEYEIISLLEADIR